MTNVRNKNERRKLPATVAPQEVQIVLCVSFSLSLYLRASPLQNHNQNTQLDGEQPELLRRWPGPMDTLSAPVAKALETTQTFPPSGVSLSRNRLALVCRVTPRMSSRPGSSHSPCSTAPPRRDNWKCFLQCHMSRRGHRCPGWEPLA